MNNKKEEQQAAKETEIKSALESESLVGILKARFFVFVFVFKCLVRKEGSSLLSVTDRSSNLKTEN